MFDSHGPGNRICRRCREANARLKVSEAELQRDRGGNFHCGEIMDDYRADESEVIPDAP